VQPTERHGLVDWTLDERHAFRGGRISHLHDIEAAALGYQVEGSDVSLFIVPGEAYRPLGLTEIGGRACLVCHSADEVGESAASLAVHH
jgi:hypothetical protein